MFHFRGIRLVSTHDDVVLETHFADPLVVRLRCMGDVERAKPGVWMIFWAFLPLASDSIMARNSSFPCGLRSRVATGTLCIEHR